MARPGLDAVDAHPVLSPARQRTRIALGCIGVFMIVVDVTIVAVALPRIGISLHAVAAELPWVVSAYTIAFAGVLLVCGRIVSNYGPERCFLISTSVFGLASLVCGIVPDFGLLIAARALQGLAAALLMPTTLTLITSTYPPGPARTKALGLWSGIGAIGASSGTTLGGLITELAGWRWVFLVNVPVVLATLAFGWSALTRASDQPPDRQRLDLIGSGLSIVGLTALVFGVLEGSRRGWGSPVVLLAIGLAAVALLTYTLHQRRWSRNPLIPPGLLSTKRVRAANLVMFLFGLGFFPSSVLVAGYLQDYAGFSPLRAGAALIPMSLALFVGAQVVGRLTHRFGVRLFATTGGGIACLGFAGLIDLHAGIPYWPRIAVPLGLIGFGVGMAFSPTTATATDVPREVGGVAAGLLNTTRQVANALGLSVLTAVAAADHAHPATGYGHAFVVATVGAVLAVTVVATRLPRRIDYPSAAAEPTPLDPVATEQLTG